MPISTANIQPGDLLLFHGNSFISWAIRKIDGTEVNHVAIALPDGRLGEAAGRGLTERPIPTTFTKKDYMLVRRHLSGESRDPVIATAEKYLANGNFYAYQQIVLLAALGLTRRIPARGMARRMLRSALDRASSALMDLLPIGASWMICSEYAYRCFDEALDVAPDPFRVEIAGVSYGAPGMGDDTWLDWAYANAADLELPVPVTFGGPDRDIEAETEAELAPLIAEWAMFAGEDEDDPLPLDTSAIQFGAPTDEPPPATQEEGEARQQDAVPDEELMASMFQFSEALSTARGAAPGVPVQFGAVPSAVTGAAVKGALEGAMNVVVDPNFVTPGDLLKSRSFSPPERAQ